MAAGKMDLVAESKAQALGQKLINRRKKRRQQKRKLEKSQITSKSGVIARPVRFGLGFPERALVKLKYDEIYNMSSTAPTPVTQDFRLTSLYDPDYTGSGGQPNWFDKLAASYTAYVVRGCNVEIEVANKSAEIALFSWAVTGRNMVTSTTNYAGYAMGGQKLIRNNDGLIKKSFYVDNFKALGLSETASGLNQQSPIVAGVGASPGLNSFLQTKVECADGTGTATCVMSVKLTFYCEFFDMEQSDGVDG